MAASTFEDISSQVLVLPADHRMRLALALMESVETDNPVPAADAWTVEISRRIEDYDSRRVKGIPAAEVFRKLRTALAIMLGLPLVRSAQAGPGGSTNTWKNDQACKDAALAACTSNHSTESGIADCTSAISAFVSAGAAGATTVTFYPGGVEISETIGPSTCSSDLHDLLGGNNNSGYYNFNATERAAVKAACCK